MNLKFYSTVITFTLASAFATSCGGGQQQATNLETRPLEESKAFEIVGTILTDRGYTVVADASIELSTGARFPADFRISDSRMAIEFLTDKDRALIGHIPPAAAGSRLHVVPARAVSDDPNAPGENVYVYFIDNRKYVYHWNPTSDIRADVTFLEVDSRLRRDLADFLSWYEAARSKEK